MHVSETELIGRDDRELGGSIAAGLRCICLLKYSGVCFIIFDFTRLCVVIVVFHKFKRKLSIIGKKTSAFFLTKLDI